MIEAVDNAMLELQRALTVRLMYPAGHHVQSCQEHAYELIHRILPDHETLEVLVLDDRVIYNDKTLPSSANLIKGLFGLLYRHGVDRITYHRGVEAGEIRSLLEELAACMADGSRRLQGTAHITFSFIKDIDTKETGPDGEQEIADREEMSALVNSLWQDIDMGEKINVNLMSDIVTSIAKAVLDSSSAMLPLFSIKSHDEYTFIHVINVAILCTTLSETLGFNQVGIHELCMAALLHDIGKRHISKELLNKGGRLTEQEMQIMQMHPVEGARMLLSSPGVPELAPIVAYEHHVGADGSGYPKVPKGWKLNLASRIVQLVDVFDALRTHRPYRQALSVPQIIEILQSDMGVCFDPDLLEVFFQHIVPRYNPDSMNVIEA